MRGFLVVLVCLFVAGCSAYRVEQGTNKSIIRHETSGISIDLPSRWEQAPANMRRSIGADQLWLMKGSADNLYYPQISLSVITEPRAVKGLKVLSNNNNRFDKVAWSVLEERFRRSGFLVESFRTSIVNSNILLIKVVGINSRNKVRESGEIKIFCLDDVAVQLGYADRADLPSKYRVDFDNMRVDR